MQVVGFGFGAFPMVVGTIIVVAQDGINPVRCVQLREYFLKTVQFVALLVYEVAGEDNQVRLLFVDQSDQLPDGFRIALPATDVYVR